MKSNQLKSTFTLSLLLIIALFTSCNKEKHYHDGVYETNIILADVTITVKGNNIYVENTLTGSSKFECKQFENRIEYLENNGTTTIIKVLKNGNLKINGILEAVKIK
ncbi:MAG: hypothetical protein Q8K70_09580 [Bacteroidota bacterium]|nr:hypothetical protein [Bacteroidota bacterium]